MAAAVIVWRINGFVLLLLFCLSVESFAQDDVQMGAKFSFVSEGIQADVLRDNWSADNQGGASAASARYYLAFQLSPSWQVGIENRTEFQVSLTDETAQFYSRLEQNHLPQGIYNLDLSVNAIAARGFFVQYFIPLSTSSGLTLVSHVYQARNVQSGQLQGEGEVFADGSFQYEYQLDYRYAYNELLNNMGGSVSGYGQSFDVHLIKQVNEWVSVKLQLDDLIYGFRWQTVNQDVGCIARPANTCRVKTSIQQFNQRFSANYSTDVSIVSSPDTAWLMGASSRWKQDDVYFGIKRGMIGVKYSLSNHFTQLSVQGKRLQFNIATDKLSLQNSQQLQLGLDVNWSLP